ncbi:MAG: transcriptional regulator [Candidatus Poribacteria bacterium]|nr:transcriptional regulator [Candidatus Poribacteria bacterium]
MREMGDWHEYLIERLTNPEKARSYLNVSLEEYQVDGDLPFFLIGLRNVVEAQGGVPTLAKRMGIIPEELSEILSGEVAPRFDMFISILTTLGYQLSIVPLAQMDSTDEALTEIGDALFVEHDKMEAADVEAKSR